jgi:predicted negative regulator of RcsB-dependent stress response
MAKESVFDKEWVDERDKNNLEGLLEQLNVPPAVINFIRRNIRMVQIVTVLVIVSVVSWALYGSYRDNKIEAASSALSSALAMEQTQMLEALAAVEEEFSGTDAALWAEVKIAQELSKSGDVEDAKEKYLALLNKSASSSSLKALLIFGAAQTSETLSQYESAADQYGALKAIDGYQEIGFNGLARIYEIQGDTGNALTTYDELLSFLAGAGTPGRAALIEEKIARLMAKE